MIRKLVKSSLKANRLVSVFMASFLLLSSALLSSALILSFGVFGTVESFMDSAETPHFMQMHLGTLDKDRMQRFADGRDEVVAWEAIEFLNVENSQLTFNGQSLDTEIQQNGFTTQPETMDHLLSPEGEVIDPEPGEIYVPYFYEDKYDLEPGHQVTLQTTDGSLEFTVAGTFRDAQMNSTLASSKRLLISEQDYAELHAQTGTTPEYLISFRLTSPGEAAGFEAAYFEAGLESNGPSLTWSLYRLINSINDAVTILLFVMMAVIILLITFLCIRYTLLATMEEDVREIGVMKALGVHHAHIQSIYVGKYRLLLGGGAIVGFLISLLLRNAILEDVRRQMGEVNYPVLGIVAGALGAMILYALSMWYVRRVLRRLHAITPLDALHGVSSLNSKLRRPKATLNLGSGRAIVRRMAWMNIRRAPSQHITILAVACLITIVLLVPFRFGSTARSADFVTYMGMGTYDLRIDLFNRDDAGDVADKIVATLDGDNRIERIEVYTFEIETSIAEDGGTSPLRVDYGDPTAFPLRYGEGRAPETTSELGLSQINAERLDVSVGETITIQGSDGPVDFMVTGIYQDITNGGKTAKALAGPTMDAAHPSMMVAIEAAEGASLDEISASISDIATDVQVIDTQTYVQQMMGDFIGVIDSIAWIFSGVAILISALIAGLSIRLMRVQERKANAVQGALGFTSGHLRTQYLLRIMSMVLIGVVLGVVLATPLGNVAGGALFSTAGISGLSLNFNLVSTVLGSALVLASTLTVTLLNTRQNTNRGIVEQLRA